MSEPLQIPEDLRWRPRCRNCATDRVAAPGAHLCARCAYLADLEPDDVADLPAPLLVYIPPARSSAGWAESAVLWLTLGALAALLLYTCWLDQQAW